MHAPIIYELARLLPSLSFSFSLSLSLSLSLSFSLFPPLFARLLQILIYFATLNYRRKIFGENFCHFVFPVMIFYKSYHDFYNSQKLIVFIIFYLLPLDPGELPSFPMCCWRVKQDWTDFLGRGTCIAQNRNRPIDYETKQVINHPSFSKTKTNPILKDKAKSVKPNRRPSFYLTN